MLSVTKNIFLLISFFVLSFAVSVFGQSDPPSTKVSDTTSFKLQNPDERYRIGYQDALAIQVFRHPELTQKVNVNTNGTINLFRIDGPIVAVCKTESELANDIAEAYKKDYLRNPEVQVIAVEQKSQAFGVMGAVEKPGSYYINRRVRLLELLAFAGGPNKEAGSRVLVSRNGSNTNCKTPADNSNSVDNSELMNYRLKDVLEAKANLVMQPGDVVYVADADVVYVYGNVNKQGQVKITEPITLTQAIASSEGLRPATKKENVRVIRQKPGSLERDEFVYNLNDIDKRKVNDPYLEPNDIVAISEDKTKSILNAIKNSVTQGLPSLFYRVP
jgi:polysaccharide biosynthesis/export protein